MLVFTSIPLVSPVQMKGNASFASEQKQHHSSKKNNEQGSSFDKILKEELKKQK